jgi:hypothetical protein
MLQRKPDSAGAKSGDLLPRSVWTAWNPGADSAVYDWILSAFTAFAAALGGVPNVQEVGFYAMDYGLNDAGELEPEPDVLAAYGGGRMAVYEAAVSRVTDFKLPAARQFRAAPSPPR